MRVFNLTDVETPGLRASGMVRQTLVLGKAIIGPGCFVDVADNPVTREVASRAVATGLLAVNVLPPAYAMMKSRLQQAQRLQSVPSQTPPPQRARIWNTKRKVD